MSVSEEKINEVTRRAQENANLIWNAANSLFGAYGPHEYGLVILPMCVIKRFHDCLETKKEGHDKTRHQEVIEAYEQYKDFGPMAADFLKEAAGYQFYNTSPYTFDLLVAAPDSIDTNFETFLNGFSDNVKDILSRMGFYGQIERMKEAKCLYQIISDFNAKNMDMSQYTSVDMGYIFENLVQRFSESFDQDAGAHFTSRDIIYLMCDLLVTNYELDMDDDGMHCTVYDMTMGTSQMLTCMEERLKQLDSKANVTTFGQEINPFTMGIAMADTIIHGGDPDNMKFGDTLSDDQFSGFKFDFCISNPPFGIDWKREASVVEMEYKKGEAGRFAPGLPAKGDGQLLFMLNGLAKLKDNHGRMAIIQNASSLFSGDAASGPSEIRRYIIENDWLDAIVQLPTDSFYNTGIATYIWLIDKSKPSRNPGEILLIDASKCSVARRKSIGNKRADVTEKCRDLIVKAYGEYKTFDYVDKEDDGTEIICKSKKMKSIEFGYQKITVETPLYDEDGNLVRKKNKKTPDTSKRDTEIIAITEDADAYLKSEVAVYNPDAWIDHSKTKIGYEIPFSRLFYEYKKIREASVIAKEVAEQEQKLSAHLKKLLGEVGE
uniref:type I restriction-modification system subunit M n=1 Tax=Roseburia faecis TaxID=301302 RepID=UPI004024FD79